MSPLHVRLVLFKYFSPKIRTGLVLTSEAEQDPKVRIK